MDRGARAVVAREQDRKTVRRRDADGMTADARDDRIGLSGSRAAVEGEALSVAVAAWRLDGDLEDPRAVHWRTRWSVRAREAHAREDRVPRAPVPA
jgi:hypothetical protein